jgi:hypothetical protein
MTSPRTEFSCWYKGEADKGGGDEIGGGAGAHIEAVVAHEELHVLENERG